MKIISKFSDYYDCGIAYGVDEKIYFKRETTLERERSQGDQKPDRWNSELRNNIEAKGDISFCGKLYRYKVRKTSKSGKPIPIYSFNRKTAVYKYYYNEETYLEDHPEHYKKSRHKWRTPEKLKEYFTIQDIGDEEFIKRGVPYFTDQISLPILKDYQFAKAVKPMEAFQEISMYLGRLNHIEPKCEIEDKYRMKGHGMDCMSYRKEGKHKKKCK